FPPSAETRNSRWFLKRDGCPTNAICLLSGDQVGCDSLPADSIFRGVHSAVCCSHAATGRLKISVSLRGSSSRLRSGVSLAIESRSAVTTESGRRRAAARKAIHLPSGETTAFWCEYFVLVSCLRAA